jgi:hypothetical protein
MSEPQLPAKIKVSQAKAFPDTSLESPSTLQHGQSSNESLTAPGKTKFEQETPTIFSSNFDKSFKDG